MSDNTATTGSLKVLAPGLHTLVVDHGRPRSRSLGVPVGGAADRWSLAIGNALVGNPPNAAALEISLTGPTLQADCPLACVVYGAPFELASDRQALAAGKTFTLQPGETLRIGGTPVRMRAYLCIRGGLQAPVVLGSRSGLRPVQTGDELLCMPATIGGRFLRLSVDGPKSWFAWSSDLSSARTLCVVPGSQVDWFPAEEFFGWPGEGPVSFTITPQSNRMGLRLQGRALTVPDREMTSEPVCPGTVQVTHNGQCIILGIDGQTIGGYPRIAQVISDHLDALGQLRPGDCVVFERVSLAKAESRYWQNQAYLREVLADIR
jgi:5-oxoprolinase (ATP-hydrolysing) subunit C